MSNILPKVSEENVIRNTVQENIIVLWLFWNGIQFAIPWMFEIFMCF